MLDVFLHFLKNKHVLFFHLVHPLNKQIVFFLQGKPLLLIIYVQKLFGQKGSFLRNFIIFFIKYLVLVVEIEKSFLPKIGIVRYLLLMLIVFWRVFLSWSSLISLLTLMIVLLVGIMSLRYFLLRWVLMRRVLLSFMLRRYFWPV